MDDIQRIHFVGIGGIGMSALARLFLHEGSVVSGSDITETENTRKLVEEGATVVYKQIAENIKSKGSDPFDLVVYTEAMDTQHPELVAARESGIKTINYFDALGMVANKYFVIAVAGSHGKTTTTAMLADILEMAEFDPTVIVGSLRSKTKSNFRAGKSKYFIIEACEYKRDFLTLEPDILVITNLELEHVDYYKNLEDVQDAFHELAVKVPEGGAVIANCGDKNVIPVIEGITCEIVDYTKYVDPLRKLKQPGLHNHLNAAAAAAAAHILGVRPLRYEQALEEFSGTWRRFEYKGEVNGVPIYDDYAHHPTEIKATIQGARELYPNKNLIVVFQSHTYTRTNKLFDDFVCELAASDEIMLAPIYAAREKNVSGVDHHKLAEGVVKINKRVTALDSFEEIVAVLKNNISKNDVVIVMGAGDVTQIANSLINA